jgi:hypothetical protein
MTLEFQQLPLRESNVRNFVSGLGDLSYIVSGEDRVTTAHSVCCASVKDEIPDLSIDESVFPLCGNVNNMTCTSLARIHIPLIRTKLCFAV